MNWDYEQPVRIIFGNGRIGEASALARQLGGSRGILITSKSGLLNGTQA